MFHMKHSRLIIKVPQSGGAHRVHIIADLL